MTAHKALMPAPAGTGNRNQDVKRIGRLYVRPHTTREPATQQGLDLAARVIASRFGLPAHVARLVCRLAGFGQEAAR
jgi:hypothetical protein